jgi:hypothetical protein
LNLRRCFGLGVTVNPNAFERGRERIIQNSMNCPRTDCKRLLATCEGIVSVGPPSKAWLNNDSFISKLLSRSCRDSFDLSRSRRKACCWTDTWSIGSNWSSVSPCCFL